MPSQRAPGQKQVLVLVRGPFLMAIDEKLEAMGYGNSAGLIRDTVYEKLARMGYSLTREIATAPSRAGKGGRSKKSKPIRNTWIHNEESK